MQLQRVVTEGGRMQWPRSLTCCLDLLQGKPLPDSIGLTIAAANAGAPKEVVSNGYEWCLSPWPEGGNKRYEHKIFACASDFAKSISWPMRMIASSTRSWI